MQIALLKRYLRHRTHSLPSPIEQALGQLVKGCKMAMLSAVLLISENEKLRIEKLALEKEEGKEAHVYS